jgi:hypothetical protein
MAAEHESARQPGYSSMIRLWEGGKVVLVKRPAVEN